jgi:hypothetical protein
MRRVAFFFEFWEADQSGGASGVVLCLVVIFLLIFAEGGKQEGGNALWFELSRPILGGTRAGW